jgi:hypothetical protein
MGEMMSLAGIVPGIGITAGVVEVEVVERVVEDAIACTFFSDRVEYMAAVSPAPVAAPAAAIKANVVFDILAKGPPQAGALGLLGVFIPFRLLQCRSGGSEK